MMRVGVVGAGFAGLMAGTRLRESGHEVVVLEARERVGGRVWSQQLVPGDPRTLVERGAEFVLEGYDTMRATAALHGLRFADMQMSYYEREPRGGAPTTPAAIAECARQVAATASDAPEGTSLAALLARLPSTMDSAALAAFVSRVVVTNAASEDRLSSVAVTDLALSFEPKPSYRVDGGNQLIATALAAKLGSAVRLNTAVRAVRWDDEGVRLVTDHDVVRVDAAVLATPLAVTRELSFEPALPPWKQQVWRRSGLGHAAKLHIPLATRGQKSVVESSAVQSVPDRFWTWTAADGSGTVQPVLHAFSGSQSALDILEVASGPQTWAQRAARLRPELDLDVERAVVTTWTDQRWSAEAYTAATVDGLPDDDELLRRAVRPLHFAGEHTAGDWAGLMEGALRSGERAAAEVALSAG